MADRNRPSITIGLILPGFFSHDDLEIGNSYYDQMSATYSEFNMFPPNEVTLEWGDGSGIIAMYQVVWVGDGSHTKANFRLIFKSATQNGVPIDRNGHPTNPNTSGSGSGSASVGGFGSQGSGYNFDVLGGTSCLSTTTLTYNGQVVGYWAEFVPC